LRFLKRGELTSINEVVRGKTQLTCLYCGEGLTAKNGFVKEYHASAHRGNLQARYSENQDQNVSLYDNFPIQISGE